MILTSVAWISCRTSTLILKNAVQYRCHELIFMFALCAESIFKGEGQQLMPTPMLLKWGTICL